LFYILNVSREHLYSDRLLFSKGLTVGLWVVNAISPPKEKLTKPFSNDLETPTGVHHGKVCSFF
jgi:hypothetical protein